MSRTTEESLSYELFSARLLPTILLIVIPFGMGIILPYLSPIFHFSSSVLQPTIGKLTVDYLTRYTPTIPLIPVFKFYHAYARNDLNMFFKKRRYEVVVNEYDYINKVLYIEVAITVTLTLLFYIYFF